jgi:glycosyltransferase involved in cell wall biosynthesis
MSSARSFVGRLSTSDRDWARLVVNKSPLAWVNNRMFRFRYVGDYHYAYQQGWLDVFADSSIIYADFHRQHGLPALYAPWGATRNSYADLGLKRDIDVLWMGKRATRRRSNLLDRVRHELAARGVQMYVVDGKENPFIHGKKRTYILNRTKITLNLTRTWYDDNYSRFSMAAPNCSLIVSEPLLPHCPECQPGLHYVSAPVDELADKIIYYLENETERQQIVEQAYQLVTTELAFQNSIKTVMNAVSQIREPRSEKMISTTNKGVKKDLLKTLPGPPEAVTTGLAPEKEVREVNDRENAQTKILMIAPQPFLEPRGTPFSVYQRLKSLAALGYQVDLLTYHLGDHVELPGLNIYRTPAIPFITQIKIGPSWAKVCLDLLLIWLVVTRLARHKYQVIHSHEEAAFFSAILARIFGVRHLYDMHSILSAQLTNFNFGNYWFIVKAFEFLERWVIKTCDAVITVGADLEKYVTAVNPAANHLKIENLALYPIEADESPNDWATLREKLALDQKLAVVYTGTFERYQGLELLLDSAKLVIEQQPEVVFILVGGTDRDVKRWRSEAEARNLADHTRFTGTVSSNEALVYLELADILISARTEGTSVPLKIYSYLQSGKPMVVTDLEAHRQVLDDSMAVLTGLTPPELSDGILQLVRDPHLRKVLGQKAAEFYQKQFDPLKYQAKVASIYQGLKNGKRHPDSLNPDSLSVAKLQRSLPSCEPEH